MHIKLSAEPAERTRRPPDHRPRNRPRSFNR